jgi:myosin protein heavy chain
LEQEISDLKKDIDDFQTKVKKIENDNKQKDSKIHQMQDEMARQDEGIAKLTRTKKQLEDTNQKTLEQLQQEEDKVNHLTKVKAKLEQTLDEVIARFLQICF